MSENTSSWVSRVVLNRIPVVASLAIGSIALVASVVTTSPIGGPVAFGRPDPARSDASAKMLYADPNPISVCNGATASTTLYWNIGQAKQYKLFRDNAGTPFKQGVGSGKYTVDSVSVGTVFRIDAYTTRIQTTKSGNRQVRTPVQVKDSSSTITISLSPATDCAPPVDPDPAPAKASFEFVTQQLPSANTGIGYDSGKISFQYHTTGTNYATNVSFSGLPAGITTGSASHPNEVIGVLPGIDGPNGQASVTLVGTPTTAGTYAVTMALTDQYGTNATKTYQLVVNTRPVVVLPLTCTPNAKNIGTGQEVSFAAAGGTGSYTWSAPGATGGDLNAQILKVSYASGGVKTVTLRSVPQSAAEAVTCEVSVITPQPPIVQPRVGRLITKADGVVYLVGDNGLIGIPSMAVFNSWCFSISDLTPANTAEAALSQVSVLETRANGQTLPAGVSVLKVTTCPAGVTPPANVQARTGQLINRDGTVLLVGDNGVIGIPTLAIFNSWCFSFGQVVEANSAERAMSQVGLLEMRAAGQTLPAGVSVLKVTTCSNTPPPAVENRSPVSSVDLADCDQNVIKGWAADPDALTDSIVVRLLDGGVGGTVIKSQPTDILRADVNTYLASQYNAGHAVTGSHGFSFDLTPIRADEKVHLFALELVDNTGAIVKTNIGNAASFVCQASTVAHASLSMSYKQITLLDKHDTSVVITDPTGRDDTTVTYKEDTVTVGDTMDICPGPDGAIGRRKNVALAGWISPNGGSIFVKDSVTNQEKWFATLVGPTPQTNMWTAQLGPGNTAITYTFRASNYYSGANTLLTKTVTVRPITGACDPGEYTLTYFLDTTPYCPLNNQYTRAYATATLENVSSQPPLSASDAIVVKFRPFGKADVPENWQVIPVEVKQAYTNDPHYFVISTLAFPMQQKGTYDFFLKFRGKTIHQVSKEYFVGIPGPFCE